jgi:hypothetical protein
MRLARSLALTAFLAAPLVADSPRKPNIIFILADDVAQGDAQKEALEAEAEVGTAFMPLDCLRLNEWSQPKAMGGYPDSSSRSSCPTHGQAISARRAGRSSMAQLRSSDLRAENPACPSARIPSSANGCVPATARAGAATGAS